MSTQHDLLSREIEVQTALMLTHEQAGHHAEAALAAARLSGLTFGQRVLFGEDVSCPHLKHHWIGQTVAGLAVWACDVCGDTHGLLVAS